MNSVIQTVLSILSFAWCVLVFVTAYLSFGSLLLAILYMFGGVVFAVVFAVVLDGIRRSSWQGLRKQ